jgi:hypothetical protein
MSNTTARADIIARIAGEIDDAFRPVVALDCADLAALAASDQAAAAEALAALTMPQLVTQAQAYASYLNAKYCDDVTGEQVLVIFQRCIAKHTPEASAPAPAAADHTAPDTSNTSNEETSMTSIIFSRDAHIDSSDFNGPSEPELPLITTLSLDPSLVVALRLLLETQHPSPQFYRALNGDGKRVGALRRLLDGASFRFDPNTRLLHIESASDAGHVYVTDGAACDCKGASHAWCWHRCAWHVVVLALALTDPHGLLAPVPLVFVAPAQPARLAA